MLSEIIKNRDEFKALVGDIKSNGLKNAYLIIGGDDETRRVFEKLLIYAILCPYGGCYTCNVCNKLSLGVHSDLKYYNIDGKMRVKDAENLITDTYVKGWESSTKLYIIQNAETLSREVQNKLLKVYEEPPEGAAIFLSAATDSGLLETVISRAKKIYVPRLTSTEIAEELKEEGIEAKLAETAAIFSDGNYGKAKSFAENEVYVNLYDRAFEILAGCKKSSDIVKYINDSAFSKENIIVTLEFFEIILRDVIELITGGDNFRTINKDFYLEAAADGFTAGGAAMAVLKACEGKKLLDSYVSAVSVAEKVLFDILEAKYKWR